MVEKPYYGLDVPRSTGPHPDPMALFNDGARAWRAGAMRSSNPHRNGSFEHKEWNSGWMEADFIGLWINQ